MWIMILELVLPKIGWVISDSIFPTSLMCCQVSTKPWISRCRRFTSPEVRTVGLVVTFCCQPALLSPLFCCRQLLSVDPRCAQTTYGGLSGVSFGGSRFLFWGGSKRENWDTGILWHTYLQLVWCWPFRITTQAQCYGGCWAASFSLWIAPGAERHLSAEFWEMSTLRCPDNSG